MPILVVEDDTEIAAFVSRGLRQSGYEVDRVESGTAGLQLAMNAGYEAAVVDLMLPGLDGLSLIEALRAAHVMTPVIVLSDVIAMARRR